MSYTYINKTFNSELNRAYKTLTKEIELNMVIKAQSGDISARNDIINSQLRKLVEIARSYVLHNSQNDISELISVGITGYQEKNGLDEAIKKFDPSQGYRLITFAFQFIKNAMRDYSLDNKVVRVPRNLSKSRPNDPELIAQFTYEAECRGMTLTAYTRYKSSIGDPITFRSTATIANASSLDSPVGSDGNNTTLSDIIAAESVDMDNSIVMSELENVLSTLDKDEIGFIREHFWNDMTMQEIGDNRNISRQAVSSRIEKILGKTKKRYGNVTA